MSLSRNGPSLQASFEAARTPPRRRKKAPPPFSLRLSPAEREKLERAAAGLPLGVYIRGKLFDGVPVRRGRGQAPIRDHAVLAQLLGMIGNMRLASNLNQLARSANIGTLPLTPEVEAELVKACAAVLAMKMELMRALGYGGENT